MEKQEDMQQAVQTARDLADMYEIDRESICHYAEQDGTERLQFRIRKPEGGYANYTEKATETPGTGTTAEILARALEYNGQGRKATEIRWDLINKTLEGKLAEWRSQEHEPTTEKQKKAIILDKLNDIGEKHGLGTEMTGTNNGIQMTFTANDTRRKVTENFNENTGEWSDDAYSEAMWLGWVSTRTEGRTSDYAIGNEEIKELSTRKKLENCAVTHAVALLKNSDTEEAFEEYGLLGKKLKETARECTEEFRQKAKQIEKEHFGNDGAMLTKAPKRKNGNRNQPKQEFDME